MSITAGTGQYEALGRIPQRGVLQAAGRWRGSGPSLAFLTHVTERPAAWVPAKFARLVIDEVWRSFVDLEI